jgi:hypothetical protein
MFLPWWVRRRFVLFFHELVHLLLLHGEVLCRSHGCGGDLIFTLRENHEEDNFFVLGNDIPTFLSRDQINGGRQSYLWYHVQLSTQSNNNTVRSKLIKHVISTMVGLK